MITITDHNKQLQPIDHYRTDQFQRPEELTYTDKSGNKQIRCVNLDGHELFSMFLTFHIAKKIPSRQLDQRHSLPCSKRCISYLIGLQQHSLEVFNLSSVHYQNVDYWNKTTWKKEDEGAKNTSV